MFNLRKIKLVGMKCTLESKEYRFSLKRTKSKGIQVSNNSLLTVTWVSIDNSILTEKIIYFFVYLYYLGRLEILKIARMHRLVYECKNTDTKITTFPVFPFLVWQSVEFLYWHLNTKPN